MRKINYFLTLIGSYFLCFNILTLIYSLQIKMLEQRDRTGYVRTYPTMFGLPHWALLCYSDTLMDVNVGKVICRQTTGLFLGRISKGELPTNYRGSYYSGSIRCKGDEMSISQCTTRMVKVLWCLNGYARVDCSSCECTFFFMAYNCYESATTISIIHISYMQCYIVIKVKMASCC